MPTPAQKNFRREMQQLNREGYSWYDSKYTSLKNKKPKWSLGLLIFVIIAILASGLPTKVYYEFQIAHDQKIKNYLQKREQYFGSADMGLKQLLTQINQQGEVNLPSLLPEIQETNTNVKMNYKNLQELNPPREFVELHVSTIETLRMHMASSDYLLTAAQTNTYRNDVLTAYVNEGNVELSKIRPSMIAGLQKAKLKYEINADGSLTYWVQEHGYESVFN